MNLHIQTKKKNLTAYYPSVDTDLILNLGNKKLNRIKLAQRIETEFSQNPTVTRLKINPNDISISSRSIDFLSFENNAFWVDRSGFYQCSNMWIHHKPSGRLEAKLISGPDGRDHPRRAPAPEGLCYERFDPVADLTVSFRALEIEQDLDMFHRWMNDGRVAYFWELGQSHNDLREYLLKLQADPHTYPLIAAFNGEDAGYFETYWACEDRLGQYYDSSPWDRGWHGLIGERKHLGRNKTSACFRAITHYLFLDCPMTESIMGEPRADHKKMLRYANEGAYEKIKEFDFPHKRSVLVQCRRHCFFSEVLL